MRPEKTRRVRDWSNAAYGLHGVRGDSPTEYGDTGSFLRTLSPGALMAGLDTQDSFLRWLVPPACRRLLGVRHPSDQRLEERLFETFGMRPSPV